MSPFWHGFEKQAGQPIPRRILKSALIGGAVGGTAGATVDKKNRWRGGLLGAVGGGALGTGVGRKYHQGIASAAKAKRKPRPKINIEAFKKVLREAQEEVRKAKDAAGGG